MKNYTHKFASIIGLLLAGLNLNSFGQTVDTVPASDPPISVAILQSTDPGCCGGLVLGKRERIEPMGTRMTNVSSLPIRAVAVVSDIDGHKEVQFTVFLGNAIEPGEELRGSAFTFDRSVKASFSFDFVEFADGTTWGVDANKKSKLIDAFFEGRQLAISRIREIVSEQDAPQFIRLATPGGLMISSDRIGPPGPERIEQSKQSGYRSIVNELRYLQAKKVGADVLADKLDEMNKSKTP